MQTSVESYWPGSSASAQIIKQDLAKIGVTLNIEKYEQAQARSRLLGSDFQLSFGGYTGAGNDPQYIIPGPDFGPNGWGKFGDDQYKALLANSVATLDRAQRKLVYGEMSEFLFERSWMMQTAAVLQPVPMRANVEASKPIPLLYLGSQKYQSGNEAQVHFLLTSSTFKKSRSDGIAFFRRETSSAVHPGAFRDLNYYFHWGPIASGRCATMLGGPNPTPKPSKKSDKALASTDLL